MSFLKHVLCFLTIVLFFNTVVSASNSFSLKKSTAPSRSLFSKTKENSHYLHDKIIVKLKSKVTLAKGAQTFGLTNVDRVFSHYSTKSIEKMFPETYATQQKETGLSRVYVAQYTSPVDAFELAREISQLPEVEYAEPWFIYPVDADTAHRPNDTSYTKNKQWALTKIKADTAWGKTTGDTTKVVGIIDTGVQWDHPDLYANIWLNPGEDAWSNPNDPSTGNGADDDNNGKIDDWRGWDFGGATYLSPVEDNNPMGATSNVGHGTHVAGIASAATNNTTGIAGIGYKCRILPIKVASDNDTRGQGGNAFIIFGFQGLKYAADVHADVVNCSWGGAGYSQFEQDVIDYASERGTLVVAAAGNSAANESQYPASYRGVMSVAARTEATNELKASYSTYHNSVDVSAPGGSGSGTAGNILSTYVGNSYAYLSGTSMAAPHVAGLVALIKSRYPWMTSEQAGEQARVTSDPKENTPQYQKLMGKGRINAYRAVKDDEVPSPSVRLISYTLLDTASDGNNNGIPDPGETVDVECIFKNYLNATTSSATVTLVSADANKISILNGSFTFDSIPMLSQDTITFRIKIGSSVTTNLVHALRFDFTDASYSDFQWIELLLNPLFVSHRTGNVAFSVSNFGSLGYFDYTQGSGVSYGDGFQYPVGDPSSLFHATLMVATDSNHVVDNAFGNPSNSTAVDWKLAFDGKFSFPSEAGSEKIIQCAFTDSGAGVSRIGLKVIQRSYAYSTYPDNDYVMLRYDIRNTRLDTIRNAYVGIYADWDVADVGENKVSYDSTRNLGYMWDSIGTSNYFGVSLLTSSASSFRAVSNPLYVYNGFTEGNKYRFMTDGFTTKEGTPITDWSILLSAGPFTIPPGQSEVVGFAFLGGDDLSDINTNADAAKNSWSALTSGLATPQLLFPPNDSAFLNTSTNLTWQSSVSATNYICQVSTDRLFFHNVVDTTINDTTIQVGPLVDSTRYFWRVRAKNASNFSPWSAIRSFVLAIPLPKPRLAISVLQNPVLTKYFDVIVSSNLQLTQNPLVQINSSVANDTIDITEIASQLYKGSYAFKSTGPITIFVYARATNGQDSAMSKTFTVGLIKRGESGVITSINGKAKVTIPINTVTEDVYITLMEEDVTKENRFLSQSYSVGPERIYSKPMIVELDYTLLNIPKDKVPFLCLFRKTGNEYQQIDSWIDVRSKKISTQTKQTGTFVLGFSDSKVALALPERFNLYQNYPNPFNPLTNVTFDIVQPSHVTITIYNSLGQLIKILTNEEFNPGNYNHVWNATNEHGISVASGVYFCRLIIINSRTGLLEYQQSISMTVLK